MNKFKREERYIVLKISDLTEDEYNHIEDYIENHSIKCRDCVLVESDWPIYEQVWDMIEQMVGEK